MSEGGGACSHKRVAGNTSTHSHTTVCACAGGGVLLSTLVHYKLMANIMKTKKVNFFIFWQGTTIFVVTHYETHLELKYLKVSVQTLIWVCYGSKM